MSFLSLQSVSKHFSLGDKIWTFGPLSLSIQKGDFVAVVGKSGSGKSTFLHLAGGLVCPDEGKIIFEGKNISALKESDLGRFRNTSLGFVFQDFFLLEELSVLDNVMIPLLIAEIPRKEAKRKAQQTLVEVGLLEKENHLPKELSGGQRQRVAIARAIIHNPPLLLADEPTGNLDTETGKQIIDLLQKLHQEKNMTLVLVTHDEILAKRAPKQIVIVDGKQKE